MNTPQFFSVSEAATKAGVDRRTIQRWLKKGVGLTKDDQGRVNLNEVRYCMLKRKVGRKAHGERFNLFWKSDISNLGQSQFCSKSGLKELSDFLSEIAVFHTARGKNAEYIASLERAISQAKQLKEMRADPQSFWKLMTKDLDRGIASVKKRVLA
jgi:hypothetical protein